MKLSCLPIYQQQAIRKWNKETIPFTIAPKKDKTLRNKLKQGVERFYTKPLRYGKRILKRIKDM